jgi:hypothetical protein
VTEELATKKEAVFDENALLLDSAIGEDDAMEEDTPDKDAIDEDNTEEDAMGDIGTLDKGISDEDESTVLSATTTSRPATSSCGDGTPGGQVSWKTTRALGFAIKSSVVNGSGVPSVRVLRSSLYISSESEKTLK